MRQTTNVVNYINTGNKRQTTNKSSFPDTRNYNYIIGIILEGKIVEFHSTVNLSNWHVLNSYVTELTPCANYLKLTLTRRF